MKRSVLIIDDARTTRTHMKLLLEAQFNTHTASSAEEGLEMLAGFSKLPDAVLLDVQMPGMGGIECLTRLKADDTWKKIPVVMVTTRGEEETLERCRAIGCDGYVTKPVQAGELFGTLRTLLSGRS